MASTDVAPGSSAAAVLPAAPAAFAVKAPPTPTGAAARDGGAAARDDGAPPPAAAARAARPRPPPGTPLAAAKRKFDDDTFKAQMKHYKDNQARWEGYTDDLTVVERNYENAKDRKECQLNLLNGIESEILWLHAEIQRKKARIVQQNEKCERLRREIKATADRAALGLVKI